MHQKRQKGFLSFLRIDPAVCLKLATLRCWFMLLVLLLISAITMLFVTHFKFIEYIPMHSLSLFDCEIMEENDISPQDEVEWIKTQAISSCVFDAIVLSGLLCVGYNLSHIPREFSIAMEIYSIAIIQLIEMFLTYFPIMLSDF